MSPPETLGALVHDYVRAQCEVLDEARAAILARDESVVHPARVAIRRLRATLRTFRAVYDRAEGSAFADELRWAGALLGQVRDLQVLVERFEGEDSGARDIVAAEIDRDLATAWELVGEGLGSPRGAELFAAIRRWHDDPPFSPKADRPAKRVKKRVAKADAAVTDRLDRAEAADGAAPDEVGVLLHDARKAAKRHRYAVELALPVLGDKAEKTIARRQELQDALGAHQDAIVALDFLQRIDLEAQSRQAALALQELIGYTRAAAEDVDGALRESKLLRA